MAARAAQAKERTLGKHKGAITPTSISVGFFAILARAVREPLRLLPAFLFHPRSVHTKIKATAIQDAVDSVKFFIFAVVCAFTLGIGVDRGPDGLFAVESELDERIFEVVCFVFLILWSAIQFLILRVWSTSKKLFQIVLAVNAGFFGYVLLLTVIGHVAASIVLFLGVLDGATPFGLSPDAFLQALRWGTMIGYVPILFLYAYVGRLVRETKLDRTKTGASIVLSAIVAWELLHYGILAARAAAEGLRGLFA